jgi:Ca-activated chloride channel family protein
MIGLLAFPAADAVKVAGRLPVDPKPAIIEGNVQSEAGVPINSAQVFLEGKNLGAQTSSEGWYRITVPATRITSDSVTITARLIGYKVESRRVLLHAGDKLTENFSLKTNPVALQQLIVTGVGAATSPPQSQSVDAAPAPQLSAGMGANGGVAGPMSLRAMKSAYANSPMPQDKLEEADEVVVMERGQALGDGKVKRGDGDRQSQAHPQRELPPVTQGTLRARGPDGEIAGEFPLKHTEIDADISGYLARTTVTQQYTNPFTEVIEAVYVFPLPSMAAVNDFMMEVGGRKIVGIVRPRAEAERIYREAIARGQTASLLTQERPNIFTQSVANIEPGGHVDIKITYFERLPYEHGEYEWVMPMVVGPRYIPGGATGPGLLAGNGIHPNNPDGGGWSPNTSVVPDASKITPPVLKPGQRSGHDIGLTVTLDAGLPITKLNVPAHHVEISRPNSTKRVIHLASNDSIPNRDFILRWSVAGDETQFGVITHRESEDGPGFLTLAMQPPAEPTDEQVTPREITFIMDVSGSMMGLPIEMSRQVVLRSLDKLRPDDRFNIVYFASGNAQLWESAKLGTEENIAAAKAFLQNINAGGGTEMLAGVERALHAHHDARYLQMYVFLTDGYVGDEPRILATIKKERGDARFFGFGIGSSVNRYLIDGIGQEGGGESFVLIPRDSAYANRGVGMLFEAIDSPVLVDVAVDWNGLPVEEVYPSKLPDLFGGQTINLIAKYTSPARGTFYVTGRVGNRRVRYPVRVTLPERETGHDALAPVWARAKIADLSSQQLAADSADRGGYERAITDLAVKYHLVSQYTAFVAVDESRIVGDGHLRRVVQPVELPEGVSYHGIFGEPCIGVPVRIGAWGIDVQETQSGKIRVGSVSESGSAAQAGITKGAEIKTVNGVKINDVAQLEQVLMQSGGTVTIETGTAVKVTLKAP